MHRAIDWADLIISIGHDTIEKPPFIMGRNGPTVIHIASSANVEQVFFPHAEVIGDIGSACRCWPSGSRASLGLMTQSWI